MTSEVTNDERNSKSIGMWYGVAAFSAWGILPLYWKVVKAVPAIEILAHRILWSCFFVVALVLLNKRTEQVKVVFANKRKRLIIGACAFFITINWGLYIWAVNSDHLVEASMGYYINPLMVTFLGMVVLKERLKPLQYVALFLATVGVLILTINYGKFPWVSVLLAASFALYGLCKKLLDVDGIVGLTLETLALLPLALGYILYLQGSGIGALGHINAVETLFLLFSGVVTATPLIWFAQAARRIDLSAVGFLQYIGPTLSLIFGVFLFKEPFHKVQAISFGFIWAALVFYTLSQMNFTQKSSSELISKAAE